MQRIHEIHDDTCFVHLSKEENTRTNQFDYISLKQRLYRERYVAESMYWWEEDITAADLGRGLCSWPAFRLRFCSTNLCEWTAERATANLTAPASCVRCRLLHGREERYNPRRTTSTTWFIVAPMYLLIKHRIDLSSAPPPRKISLSSTPLHQTGFRIRSHDAMSIAESINSFAAS